MPRSLHSFWLRSVRGRLLLLVSAIVFPALLLAVLLILQAYRNERAAVAERLANTGRAVAGMVDGQVDNAHTLLKALAATHGVQVGDYRLVDETARRALAGEDRWFVLTDATGQQQVNTRVPSGTPLPLETNFAPEFTAAMAAGREFVSDLREGGVARRRLVHVSVPYNRSGKLNGSLNLAMLPETLAKTMNLGRFEQGGVVTVLDRQGRIITRSRGGEKFVGHSASPDMLALIAEGRDAVLDSVTLDGVPVITAVTRARCGWTVVIGAPKADLYASAQRLAGSALLGSGLVLVLGAAMALWIARKTVRSVDSLKADAEAIGEGRMPVETSSGLQETDFVATAMRRTASTLLRRTQTLELMNRVNADLVAERDLEKIVQSVTDAGREVSGAAFGAFFYNVENDAGESYTLFTLSGAPREAFEKFGMPRNTPVFAATFSGEGSVRVADIRADPRYGKLAPHHGMPKGHLPVRSYLAVPVKGRSGAVIGGLFFGHPEPDIFTAEAEQVVVGLAAEAAIAIENAKLYKALERELEAKSKAEAELRRAQAKLSAHAHELERMVQARTASLREAVAQMEEFSYTVSHDLRSPLRSMNAFASLLLEDYGEKLDETARDYLRRIARASERMNRLTTDLLSYSRVARAEVELAPTDVEKIVQGNIEQYPELHAPAQVTVATPLARVLAHEPSLSQALANLLTNAAKFVRPGEAPRITVRTESREGRVRIWVEDQGIGIPPAAQASLFKIFERLSNGTKYEGTGIGLAIVRKAAEKMGGTAGVESDGVSGSRFWIELAAA